MVEFNYKMKVSHVDTIPCLGSFCTLQPPMLNSEQPEFITVIAYQGLSSCNAAYTYPGYCNHHCSILKAGVQQ